jgi:two-component system, OmpR family, alkaline phosphatase synthesis response regulator PhoP
MVWQRCLEKTFMSDTQNNKGKVLIVEDDEHIALLLEYLLRREGFDTELAADGKRAEELIRATAPPELVILDNMLPYRSGLELIAIIRSLENWKAVPVLMLTAKSQEQDIVTALDAGISDYVVKPFQPNEILARLRRLLRG